MIFRMCFWAGNVQGVSFFGETVLQLRIDRDQVDIVHYYVIIFQQLVNMQEPNVDERRSIESVIIYLQKQRQAVL